MYKAIIEKIENNDSIVIFGHLNPDGDCYGSQIALRQSLKLKYPHKKVYAVGSGLHRFFKLLGSMDAVPEKVIERSLAIIVDGNDLPRMEDQRVFSAKEYIKFDHHVDTGSFTEGPYIVKEDATSCSEILLDFFLDNDYPIDATIAQALLLGIITDSDRFQFTGDFTKVFKESAFLCEKGANPEAINAILNQTSEKAAAFKGYVYTHYKKTQHGVLYIKFTNNQLQKFRLSPNAASGMVNLLSNLKGYPVWAFVCENGDGSFHIELRSNGPVVQPIAHKYGGGGHAYAAGTTIQKSQHEIISNLIEDLDLACKQWKEENK